MSDETEYETTGIITSSLAMKAMMAFYDVEHRKGPWRAPYDRVWADMDRIRDAFKVFDREVWLGGLGAEYMASNQRGFETTFGPYTVMISDLAGRVLLTFNLPGGHQITTITDDCVDESRMGQQSIDATADEVVAMFDRALKHWNAGGLGINHNPSIRVAGT